MTIAEVLDGSMETSAPFVGPFVHGAFLAAAERAVGRAPDDLAVYADDHGAVALVRADDEIRFAGEGWITDYHAPLGDDPVPCLIDAFTASSGLRYRFDSLPAEAADVVRAALGAVAAPVEEDIHESTAVYTRSDHGWLSDIGKKQRHEVKRKRRRLEAELGAASLVEAGAQDVSRFCDVHRSNSPDKEAFMTDTMERFFAELIEVAGARIHNLEVGGRVVASAFGFPCDDAYYLYNSAYDMGVAALSPGAVLLGYLIEHELDRGVTTFDFLKGDEVYKRRHGGVPRPLHRLTGVLP